MTQQVLDNPQSLELMLKDIKSAEKIYQPTNYWTRYEKELVPELRKTGLRNFRRRKNSILESFGATDFHPTLCQFDFSRRVWCGKRWFANSFFRKWLNRIPNFAELWSKLLSMQDSRVNQRLSRKFTTEYNIEDIERLSYELVRRKGKEAGAKPIEGIQASLAGNPADIFKVGDRIYTASLLGYYLEYAYCCNFTDFDNIKIVVELGSGSGKQVEVIRKFHPDVCFLLFDIPPQLYVCQQYLSAVFPDSVVSYEKTRNMETLPKLEKGKIFIFGSWKFPILEQVNIDLFWNAASFQEMEPEVVANYLFYVNSRASAVFLHEMMGGQELAKQEGKCGVIKKTTLEDYKKGLSNFQLVDISQAEGPIKTLTDHSNSFWKKIKD
ncbi:putative sugar O-methyltransferase [Candidatus Omnitrophota bacterium]